MLVAVNLVPLIGVAFFGWTLFSVMFLYWLESAIVGFFNVLKIAKARGEGISNFEINGRPADEYTRFGLISFFVLHYGFFMAIHGALVFAFFGPPDLDPAFIVLVFALLIVSHGMSYISNFIMQGEYRLVSPAQQMSGPYRRIALMHVTLLLAGLMAKSRNGALGALIFMVVLKIVMDLTLHVYEHRRIQALAPGNREGPYPGPHPVA